MSDEQAPVNEWTKEGDAIASTPASLTDGPTVLDARELIAGYIPEVNILNGCNLSVHAGEFVGIIGPNGAGKSTLLKAILGQCSVRSGTVHLGEVDITGRKAHELVALGVGYVPQVRNVFPSLTVSENLEMGCYLAPKRFPERFDYVTTLFPRLGERAAQRAGALSGGERQMVAMGRALMMEPSVLLLDEPSAGPVAGAAGRGVRALPARSTRRASRSSWSSRTPAAASRWCTAATCSTRARTPTPAPAATCSATPTSSSSTSARWPRPPAADLRPVHVVLRRDVNVPATALTRADTVHVVSDAT